MLSAFCLRLALGMIVPLPLLPDKQMHPKFYRTQFLTALGLTIVATVWEWSSATATGQWLLAGSVVVTLAGSIVWALNPPPFGKLMVAVSVALLGTLVAGPNLLGAGHGPGPGTPPMIPVIDGITSALLMGTALTAMLVGHSYLISPGMTLQPLNRMLAAFGLAWFARMLTSLWGYWLWTDAVPAHNLSGDVGYWLPTRWLVGLLAPAVFGAMAWLTARIRSTQSATGILYVVVICCVLGELLAQLLRSKLLFPL